MCAALAGVFHEHQFQRWVGDGEVGVPRLHLRGRGVEQLGVERDGLVEVIDVEGELSAGHTTPTFVTYVELLTDSDHAAPLRHMSMSCGRIIRMPKTLPVVDMSAPVCCSPVAAGPLDDDEALEIALRLKALADPVRVKLVSLLFSSDAGEVCSCDLAAAVGLTESTVSHHLTQLRRAGLVESERRGMNVYHRPRRDALIALCSVLDPNCCS